ncbi:hypothetical protein ES703_90731 [subsurface metagenome]
MTFTFWSVILQVVIWENRTNRERKLLIEKIPVFVYLDAQTIVGNVSLPSGKRLSDLLNSSVMGQPESSTMFLELTDVTISHADGTKEQVQTSFINKTTIQLLTTLDENLARGIGAKDGPKRYPYVHKSPVRARMRMPSYEITGNIYCTNGQRTPQLLEEELMFFPLTDARIRVSTGGDWWGANFVAVNRRQIFSLQCEEIRLGS